MNEACRGLVEALFACSAPSPLSLFKGCLFCRGTVHSPPHTAFLTGSCWAVAVVDAVASAVAILSGNQSPPDLSYQQLLQSPAAFTKDPCGGGSPWKALSYLSQAGAQGQGLTTNVRHRHLQHRSRGLRSCTFLLIYSPIDGHVQLCTCQRLLFAELSSLLFNHVC